MVYVPSPSRRLSAILRILAPALPAGVLLAALLPWAPPTGAVERLEISVGEVVGPTWSVRDAALALDLGAGDAPPALTGRAAALRLPRLETLEDVTVSCPGLTLDAATIACRDGAARLPLPFLDAPGLRFSLRLGRAEGRGRVEVGGLRAAGGTWSARARGAVDDWSVEASGEGIGLAAAAALARPRLPLPAGLTVEGTATVSVSAKGAGTAPGRVSGRVRIEDGAFSDAAGLRAGEGLAATLEANAERRRTAWRLDAEGALAGGAVYVDPWYVAAAETPLTARCEGLLGDGGALHLEDCRFSHPGVLEASGSAHLTAGEEGRVEAARAEFTSPDLGRLYSVYLQPLGAGTPAGQLAVSGTAAGGMELAAGAPAAARLELEAASVEEDAGRLGIHGITGAVHWRAEGEVPDSVLAWDGGNLWSLDFGPATLEARAAGERLALLQPLALPLLDGELVVEAFGVGALDQGGLGGELAGYLTPVSMARLASGFGWPVFGGQVSGVLPEITFSSRRVTIAGALLMNIFDGQVVLKDLVLDDPLGLVPELRTSLDMTGIDLELLTQAFSFGRIQGRLDGRIRGLVLQDWAPVAFDARFETPAQGDFTKRISQEAVDDLTRVGGGAGIGGALFLGLFEQFRYDAIGLGCELAAGVCTMAGLGPADPGYYIVRGAGLPRIDVIGYNRLVDWNTLVTRLRRVTTSGPALVE